MKILYVSFRGHLEVLLPHLEIYSHLSSLLSHFSIQVPCDAHSFGLCIRLKLPRLFVSIVCLLNSLLYRTTDLVVFLLLAEGDRAMERRHASGNPRKVGLHNAVYLH